MLLLIIGGWFILFSFKNKEKEMTYIAESAQKTTENKASYAKYDKDGDGLLDWIEILRGTDPTNPDTDGDGTEDGEEVALHRNPLKNGDDAIVFSEDTTQEKSSGLTSAIAGGITAEYLFLKEDGGIDKNQMIELLNEQVTSYIQNAEPLQSTYTEKDLKIIPSDDAAIFQYANAVGLIFKNSFADTHRSEIILLNEILTENSFDRLQEFEAYTRAYETATAALKNLSVPVPLASTHLALLNNFANLARASNAFKNFEHDPASALLYLRYYQSEVERFKIVIKNINISLADAGIFFNEQDAGAILVDYYSQLKNNGAI